MRLKMSYKDTNKKGARKSVVAPDRKIVFNLQMDIAEREIKEREYFLNKPKPSVGPRLKFFHYFKDLNLSLEECIEKIMEEYPAIKEEDIIGWIKEEIKKERSEKSDEGR